MRRTFAVAAVVAMLLGTGSMALAQSPPPAGHPPGGQGSMGHGMMGQGAMCPMMGQPMMGPGMAGGPMVAPGDPKAQARMLRMRGDMMKAMGEVMLKHAQELDKDK